MTRECITCVALIFGLVMYPVLSSTHQVHVGADETESARTTRHARIAPPTRMTLESCVCTRVRINSDSSGSGFEGMYSDPESLSSDVTTAEGFLVPSSERTVFRAPLRASRGARISLTPLARNTPWWNSRSRRDRGLPAVKRRRLMGIWTMPSTGLENERKVELHESIAVDAEAEAEAAAAAAAAESPGVSTGSFTIDTTSRNAFGTDAYVRATLTPSREVKPDERFESVSPSFSSPSSSVSQGQLVVSVRPLLYNWATPQDANQVRRMLRQAQTLTSGSLWAAPSSLRFRMGLSRLVSENAAPARENAAQDTGPASDDTSPLGDDTSLVCDETELAELEVGMGTFRDTGPLTPSGRVIAVRHMLVASFTPLTGKENSVTFLVVLVKESNVQDWLSGSDVSDEPGSESTSGNPVSSNSQAVPFCGWVVKVTVLSSVEKLRLGRPTIAFHSSRSIDNWSLHTRIIPTILDVAEPNKVTTYHRRLCDVVGFHDDSMAAFQREDTSSERLGSLSWRAYIAQFGIRVGTVFLGDDAQNKETVFGVRVHVRADSSLVFGSLADFAYDVEVLSPGSMTRAATASVVQSSGYYTVILSIHSSSFLAESSQDHGTVSTHERAGTSIRVCKLTTRSGRVLGIALLVDSPYLVRAGKPVIGFVVML